MNNILNVCLVKDEVDLSGFQIVRDDGSAVQAQDWNSIVQTEKHPIIAISLNLLTSNIQESTLAIERSHSKVKLKGEGGGDSSDSKELDAREVQDSSDEVYMPSRRTTFNQDQTFQDMPPPPRPRSTRSFGLERNEGKPESVHQAWALARRASYKDTFEPMEPQRQISEDDEDSIRAPKQTSASRHKLRGNNNDIVIRSRPQKNRVSPAIVQPRNLALIRASKDHDSTGTNIGIPPSRDRKYPKKVSIEVINEKDEDDDHDIYYSSKSTDPAKTVGLQGSTSPQEHKIKADQSRQSTKQEIPDSMRALLNNLLQSSDQSSTLPQRGQSGALVPPVLSWKAGKPSDLTDEETKAQNRLPSKSKRCCNIYQEVSNIELFGRFSNKPCKCTPRCSTRR